MVRTLISHSVTITRNDSLFLPAYSIFQEEGGASKTTINDFSITIIQTCITVKDFCNMPAILECRNKRESKSAKEKITQGFYFNNNPSHSIIESAYRHEPEHVLHNTP
ncbi:unnamed protein product, partial [Cuscuta epithymum]